MNTRQIKRMSRFLPGASMRGIPLRTWLTLNISVLAVILIMIVGFVSAALSMNTAYTQTEEIWSAKIRAAAAEVAVMAEAGRLSAELLAQSGNPFFPPGTWLFIHDRETMRGAWPGPETAAPVMPPATGALPQTMTGGGETYVIFQAPVPRFDGFRLTAAVPISNLRTPYSDLTKSLLQVGLVALFFSIMGAYLISTLLVHNIAGTVAELSDKATQEKLFAEATKGEDR